MLVTVQQQVHIIGGKLIISLSARYVQFVPFYKGDVLRD